MKCYAVHIYSFLLSMPMMFLYSCGSHKPEIIHQRSVPESYVPGSFLVTLSEQKNLATMNDKLGDIATEYGCKLEASERINWGSSDSLSVTSEEESLSYSVNLSECNLDRDETGQVLAKFDQIEGVVASEAEALAAATPFFGRNTDPYRSKQYYLDFIHRDNACELSKANGINQKTVKIAVLDSGLDLDHPDLNDIVLKDETGNLVMANFVGKGSQEAPDQEIEDLNGHGTHVAGTIAARSLNREGITGLASCMNVKIIPVRVLNAKGLGSSIEINRGIRWAVDQGAQIVNLSLGYEISLSKTNTSMFKNDFFARLAKRGVVVFAAAGNDGFVNGSSTNSGVRYSFPASYDHVIAVAATDKAGKLSDFTVRGDRIDIAAPGTRILATYSEGSYVYSSGTSMASPIAAGSYGLALANIIDRLGPLDRISPNISIDSVESALVTGFTLEKSDVASQGIIDASKLLSILDTKFPLKKVDAPDEGEKDESSSTRGSSGNGGSEVSSDNSGDTTTSDNTLNKVTFAFEGLSEGQVVSGFHNIQLQGVPSDTVLIALYWGEKKAPFTTINVQSESEVKTKTRWSFKGIGKLRAYAFSANRNVVAKTEILLQGK